MQKINNFEKKQLTKKSEDLSRWYTEVIQLAELADYGPARGTMVIRPYGYTIWENIQKFMDAEFKASGVENAYFPLFIPNSLFKKEKEHVEGFAPETAVVTIGGGEKLAEPLIVRPTSEMVMYELYAKWISSWRDLPLLINQWNNVVRWEKRTFPFLRTSEFLWQEGHCAHVTHKESWERVLWAIETYAKTYRKLLAIDGYVGKKSESEKFAGAVATLPFEPLMPDGKILQGCTSHDLGQNFSKALNITFQKKDGSTEYVWQNSWGFSTRVIGGLILAHGDDNGLVLPPKVAPVRVVIIPILGKKDNEIIKYCEKIKAEFENKKSEFPGKVEIWDDTEKSYGWKVNEAEIKGIPVKISIGSRELEEKAVTMDARVEEVDFVKLVKLENAFGEVESLLEKVQAKLFDRSRKYLKENTRRVKDYQEFKKIMKTKRGIIKTFWCEDAECEKKIKEETKATTRLKKLDAKKKDGKCICCGKKADYVWYFGHAY